MTTTQPSTRLHHPPRPAAHPASAGADVVTLTGVRRTYGARRGLGLGKAAGGFEAVRGVDLTIRRGGVYALLGTNGAGKTSTVELIEGLGAPSAGTIRVFGLDPIADRARVRPRTGVVLQESGFPATLTVREVARMWAGTLTDPRAIDNMLADVDLAGCAGTAVQSLSGGEKRRLDVGLGILGRPELLVLDEPTTGLDPESRRRIWHLIEGMVAHGTTVLLTTHYLEEAERLADRIAIMHAGRIVTEGTLDDIVAGTPASITFRRPDRLDPATLDLPGASVTVGDLVSIETRTLQATLARVLAWAGDETLPGLTATPASLESVFLAIASGGVR